MKFEDLLKKIEELESDIETLKEGMISMEDVTEEHEIKIKSLQLKVNSQVVQILEGTTHATADTQLKFRHGLTIIPSYFTIAKGNIYVQDLDAENLDIRSPQSSQVFKIVIFGDKK